VAEAMPGMVQSVSISKPTLDDVFIRRTGHRFWTEQEQDSEKSKPYH
jgi:ABC-2 type transport system ATP-binding protein